MPATAHQDTTDNAACRDNHIVGKARRIVVKQSANDAQWARKREGDFNCTTGNMTALRQSITDAEVAQTELSYDDYGNLQRIVGPANLNQQRLQKGDAHKSSPVKWASVNEVSSP